MPAEAQRSRPAAPFSGSYDPSDVAFLLTPVTLAPTPVAEKERLIQSGARHYSEMIAPERPPQQGYLELYERALTRNGARLGADIATLAAILAARANGREVVIVSLARAGTPIGVLLLRTLRARGVRAVHYSISIIRGRGIDEVALAHIAARHDPRDAVFVDGWTGKGAIAGELERTLAGNMWGFAPTLAVIADPAGCAEIAATDDDYLIASGLLNSVVSGLVSRSILSAALIGPEDFHGCVYYGEYAAHDVSRAFVDAVEPLAIGARVGAPIHDHAARRPALRRACEGMLRSVMDRAGVSDRNRIKPGIAEATRALLRRVPDRLFLRNAFDADVRHLLYLAQEHGVRVEPLTDDSGYRAVAVIAGLDAA